MIALTSRLFGVLNAPARCRSQGHLCDQPCSAGEEGVSGFKVQVEQVLAGSADYSGIMWSGVKGCTGLFEAQAV
jgi:hypothetical protein